MPTYTKTPMDTSFLDGVDPEVIHLYYINRGVFLDGAMGHIPWALVANIYGPTKSVMNESEDGSKTIRYTIDIDCVIPAEEPENVPENKD